MYSLFVPKILLVASFLSAFACTSPVLSEEQSVATVTVAWGNDLERASIILNISECFDVTPDHLYASVNSNKTSSKYAITKVLVIIEKTNDTAEFHVVEEDGGVGKKFVALTIKPKNTDRLNYRVLIYGITDLPANQNVSTVTTVWGNDIEGATMILNVSESSEISPVYSQAFINSSRADSKYIITKVITIIEKTNEKAVFHIVEEEGGIGDKFLALSIKPKNTNRLNYQVLVYGIPDFLYQTDLRTVSTVWGDDMEGARIIFNVTESSEITPDYLQAFISISRANIKYIITKVLVVIERTNPVAEFLVVQEDGGVGKEYVDLSIKPINTKRLNYKLLVYGIPKSVSIETKIWGKDVEGANVILHISESSKVSPDYLLTSLRSEDNSDHIVTKVLLTIEKGNENAKFRAILEEGGIGKNFVALTIMSRNTYMLSYNLLIYGVPADSKYVD